MKRLFAVRLPSWFLVAFLLWGLAPANAQLTTAPPADGKQHIDVVFCYDISGSMIHYHRPAEAKILEILSGIQAAEPDALLRVGLITYYDKKQFEIYDLSPDVDKFRANLAAARHDRIWGEEWVGYFVHLATTQLKWSEDPKAIKLIYVVGNEKILVAPGQFDYHETVPEAVQQNIIVNAVLCGWAAKVLFNQQTQWQELASLGHGQYIDLFGGGKTPASPNASGAPPTPFDKTLDDLNQALNQTYIPVGLKGSRGKAEQEAVDLDTIRTGTYFERVMFKATPAYDNRSWDLLDGICTGIVDLSKIANSLLPLDLRTMTLAERQAFVKEVTRQRLLIQKQILQVGLQRLNYLREWLAQERMRQASIAASNARNFGDSREGSTTGAGTSSTSTGPAMSFPMPGVAPVSFPRTGGTPGSGGALPATPAAGQLPQETVASEGFSYLREVSEGTEIGAQYLDTLEPSVRRELLERVKLFPVLRGLEDRVALQDENALAPEVVIIDGKVQLQIRLSSLPFDGAAKLNDVGFETTAHLAADAPLTGEILVGQIDKLIELPFVRLAEPAPLNNP